MIWEGDLESVLSSGLAVMVPHSCALPALLPLSQQLLLDPLCRCPRCHCSHCPQPSSLLDGAQSLGMVTPAGFSPLQLFCCSGAAQGAQPSGGCQGLSSSGLAVTLPPPLPHHNNIPFFFPAVWWILQQSWHTLSDFCPFCSLYD